MKSLYISILLICTLTFVSSKCPDIKGLRTDFVKNNLNLTKLNGMWYEHAYEDLA